MRESKNKLKIVWDKIKVGVLTFLITAVIGFFASKSCSFIEKASELRKATEYAYSVEHKHYTQLQTFVVSQTRLYFLLNDLIFKLNKSGHISEKDFDELKMIIETSKTQMFSLIREQKKVIKEVGQ